MKLWKRDYYEKLFANKLSTQTVQDYQREIQEAQKKIEDLQAKCNHTNHDLVFYSWRPGAMQPSYVCTECSKYLGSANEEDSKKLWDNYHKGLPDKAGVINPS